MQYFWSWETELPPGSGVVTFGPVHLAWVGTGLVIVALLILWYRRLSTDQRMQFQRWAVRLLVAGYFIRWIWAALIGHYSVVQMLPLHLCNISVIVEYAAVRTGRITLKEFSCCCSLPAAIASLVTPGMGAYPLLHYYYLQFALAHLTLILLPLVWILVDGYRPDIRRFPHCFGILAFFAAIAFTVNQLIGSNYMFLSYAPADTPLLFFEKQWGNPGYLVPTLGLILAIWILFYLPWVAYDLWQRSRTKLRMRS